MFKIRFLIDRLLIHIFSVWAAYLYLEIGVLRHKELFEGDEAVQLLLPIWLGISSFPVRGVLHNIPKLEEVMAEVADY